MEFPRIYNAAADFVDRNMERGYGDKAAFIGADRTLTYGGLHDGTCRMAAALKSLGVKQETRIALLLHDTVDFPVAFWGAIRAGVIPVCLNTLLTGEQYGYLLADSRAEALFVSAALLDMVTPVLDRLAFLRHVVVAGGDRPDRLSFDGLLAGASPRGDVATTSPDEVAFWLYSSGSTGDPKGVRHIHSSPMYVAHHYGKGVIGIRHADVAFSTAKLHFAYGLGAGMAVPMSVGATTVLLAERPTPQTALNLMQRHQPSLFFGVPTLYAAMLADPACTPENFSRRLRLCVSAGEALPAEVGSQWEARFGVKVIDGIGSTEMLHAFVSNTPADNRYGTSGKPVPGYKVRLVDEAGHAVSDGEIGEILVSGGSAAEGYWNQRAKSQATFEGRWVRTGDKFFRDAEGYYHYCGRTDDMFKVSGRWVSPFEVEQALISHPAVLEAAVVAREDVDGLVKPRAFVVLQPDAREDGLFDCLKEHVKTSIGPWKYPRWIDFVGELPKTPTGKIQRYKLRVQRPA
jgi:4-hydroxybenzoate-CoA ligase